MMDFKQKWTDQDLYRYFELSDEEIAIIESTMRPLALSGDSDIISDSDEWGDQENTIFSGRKAVNDDEITYIYTKYDGILSGGKW